MYESFLRIFWQVYFNLQQFGLPGPPAGPPADPVAAPPPPPVGEVGQTVAQQPQEAAAMWPMFVIWGVVFVGFYFLFMRPQRKREKQRREMQAAITAGDNVVTTGGMFGKVTDVGEDSFVVEFGINKGVKVAILKSDVQAVREPRLTPPPKPMD